MQVFSLHCSNKGIALRPPGWHHPVLFIVRLDGRMNVKHLLQLDAVSVVVAAGDVGGGVGDGGSGQILASFCLFMLFN